MKQKDINKNMFTYHSKNLIMYFFIGIVLIVFMTMSFIYIHFMKNLMGTYIHTSLYANQGSNLVKEVISFLGISLGLYFIIYLILLIVFTYIYITNQRQNRKLYEIAYVDPITNLGNETYFKEKGTEFLKSNLKNKYVSVFDIEKFKMLNKMYDEHICNKILKNIGVIIKNILPEGSIISRTARDNFTIAFIYNGEIEKLVNKILESTNEIDIEGIKVHINLSFGIYKVNKEDDIISALDKAYLAHSEIKGIYDKYYIFDESLEKKLIEEQNIELEMERALKENEFKVVYQPKINVKNDNLIGAEALVRWERNGKVVLPNKFIPLFEKNRFIIKLDLFVFEKVCRDMEEWKKEYGFSKIISVNVSKDHFVYENFIDDYVKIAKKYNIDPSKIELEITESTTIDENIDILKIVNKIKKQGFQVSIDDFGTGYSSLNLLQNLKVDTIKIDKTFIENANLRSQKNIINHITLIAKHLNLKTIVEGVETKTQANYVKKIGCDMIQGYYYSKPLSKEAFVEYFNAINKK